MKKLKKLFYYLFNDFNYLKSYFSYKLRSNKSIFFILFRYIIGNFSNSKAISNSLLFVYDLELNPLTFNFGQHLANAVIESKKKSIKNVDLLIIKSSSSNPIKTKKLKLFMGENEAENRIYELIVSSFRLSQKSNNLYLSNNDDKNIKQILSNYKYIYPKDYSFYKPISCPTKLPNVDSKIFFPMYQANSRSKEIINKYLENFDNNKIITFTFRDLKHMKNRNTQYDEWVKFSQYLLKKNYTIFLVPDPLNYNPKFFHKFLNCHIAEIVLWNINLRTALYEAAFLNCSVSSGIFEVSSCYNHNSESLMFLDFDSYGKEYLDFGRKNWGYKDTINQNWMSISQYYVYEKDNCENMIKAFEELMKKKNIKK